MGFPERGAGVYVDIDHWAWHYLLLIQFNSVLVLNLFFFFFCVIAQSFPFHGLPIWMTFWHPPNQLVFSYHNRPYWHARWLIFRLTFFSNQEIHMAVVVGHSDLGLHLWSLQGWVDLPWTAVICLTDLSQPTTHLCCQIARWSWNATKKIKEAGYASLSMLTGAFFFYVWKYIVLFSDLLVKGSDTWTIFYRNL